MDNYKGEFVGMIIGILLLIVAYGFSYFTNENRYDNICIKGYLFTSSNPPVQILDQNRNPIICENTCAK